MTSAIADTIFCELPLHSHELHEFLQSSGTSASFCEVEMGSYGSELTEQSKPHVVILTVPAPGHIFPSLALGRALARRGVKVTFLSSGCVPEKLLRDVDEDEALDMTVGTVLDDPLLEPENPMALVPWLAKLPGEEMAERAVGVIARLQPPPCCLVSDVFIWWTGMVEERLGIPRHFLVTMSASSLSFMFSVPLFAREGILPLDLAANVELPVPGVGNIPEGDVWEYFIKGGMFQMDAMILCLRAFTESFPRATYLVNSTEELEPEAFQALSEPVPFTGQVAKVVSIGPLEQAFASKAGGDANSSEAKKSSKQQVWGEVEEWLEAQAEGSVMYISFGTIFSLPPEQVVELAHGVEASGHRFLWIIRPPNAPHIMLSKQPTNADISAILPPGFEERTKGRGLLYSSWAPQPKILSHKAVGLFLSHCGWNSTLEAISTATPVLGRPLFTDQWFNATILEKHFRIGTVLRDGEFERRRIEASIKAMMEGDEGRDARRNVTSLNRALRDASSGRSCEHLEEYVSELFAMDKRLNRSHDS